MSPHSIYYDGSPTAPPPPQTLRAGPLTLDWQAPDLREIRLGQNVVLRRVYAAVRDRNWGTIPGALSDVRAAIQPDAFQIDFHAEHVQGEIDFAWDGRVTGSRGGEIRCELRGTARTGFWKNRIGLCLLHPAELAGAPMLALGADGAPRRAALPLRIAPEQPVPGFGDLRALAHEVTPGLWALIALEGDLFEMEDQRNWTDASFKTFSTPLRLPYPAWIEAGTVVEQSITLRLVEAADWHAVLPATRRTQPAAAVTASDPALLEPVPALSIAPEPLAVEIVLDSSAPEHTLWERTLPPLGLGLASRAAPLDGRETGLLRDLHLDHLRADLWLDDPAYPAVLGRAVEQAAALGARLHLALYVPQTGFDSAALAALIHELQPPVEYWLVYPAVEQFNGGSPVAQALAAARAALDGIIPGAKFAAGTDADLIFLQRSPPPVAGIDALCFALNPQVHAFDNRSVVETLAAHGAAVATAQHYAGGRPILVSPVTLRPRRNVYASAPAVDDPHTPPPQVDPRQMSLLGAGWTLGAVTALAQAGASSLTFYETTGARGLIHARTGAEVGWLPAEPGAAFPIYHLFAELADFAGGWLLPASSSEPLAVAVLALEGQNGIRILLANLTPQPRAVTLRGLPCLPGSPTTPAAGPGPELAAPVCTVNLRRLDETTVQAAMRDPLAYRALPRQPVALHHGSLDLELLPYALAFLDLPTSPPEPPR